MESNELYLAYDDGVKAERARLRAAVEGMKKSSIFGYSAYPQVEVRDYVQERGYNNALVAVLKILEESNNGG